MKTNKLLSYIDEIEKFSNDVCEKTGSPYWFSRTSAIKEIKKYIMMLLDKSN